jgi:MYXO-CTERM domain-containing protein
MRSAKWLTALFVSALAISVYCARDAAACGGCFHLPPPPSESVDSVITGERMIFSISKDQTTLYDEITYSGSPKSFAWVLPIKGEVEVGLSADILFATIDSLTASEVHAPPTGCPRPQQCASSGGGGGGFGAGCGGGFGAGPSSSSGSGYFDEDAGVPEASSGVSVLTQEQVGPYEAVQLKSSDGSALTKWLDDNGYVVPKSDEPVIKHYVAAGMDFLALKLLPGLGVQAMQPVRVTTHGAFPVLPLLMVSVGTGATTGITLWVVGEGRWEPQNFPTFTIDSSELDWDWKTSSSNYEPLRLSKEAALGGRGWQIESSLDHSQYAIRNALSAALAADFGGKGGYADPNPMPPPRHGAKDAGATTDAGGPKDAGAEAGEAGSAEASVDGGGDAAPVVDGGPEGAPVDASLADTDVPEAETPDVEAEDSSLVPPSEQQLAEQDLDVLFEGVSGPNARITRMRTDIVHSALSDDLVIRASADQTELSASYHVSSQIGQPLCPIYNEYCTQTGELPRDQARAQADLAPADGDSSGGCSGCRTTSGPTGSKATIGILVALAGLGAVRGRRRR